MVIEKIELIGFKSFGDRTSFDLHAGITSIVGPNGCGKSNVVDAFKWVLGEQSVKSMRGAKMEEVIFAGSQTKKPRGMAEVSLYIRGIEQVEGAGKDNLTTISRRLFRSGESEYMINRKVCRLKDIRNIFLDTGLEVKSYSMLEQDRVSSIVTAKADDRRFLIEEVAGVVKYKVRRNEAMGKLESSRNNLSRVSDIINEIKRQLNSLDRQAKKAERYKKLMSELRDIEIRIAKRDYTQLSSELERIISELSAARQQDGSVRAEFSKFEADIETRRIALTEQEKAIEAEQVKLHDTERQMSELGRSMAVSKTEREHLGKSIERLTEQGKENNEKRSTASERIAELTEQASTLQQELEGLETEAGSETEALKSAEGAIKDREHNLDNRRRDSFRMTEEIGAVRNDLSKQTAAQENLQKKSEELTQEGSELTKALAESERKRQEIQAALMSRNNELMVFRQERETLTKEIEALKEKLNTLNTDTSEAREQLASTTSRIESLREMDVTEAAEETLKDSINITALISDSLESDSQYERAVEAALTETVNGFVVPSYVDISSAIAVLNEKGTERTAFIPSEVTAHTEPKPEGALAMAWEVARPRPGMQEVVKALLGRTVIVEDIQKAIALKDTGLMIVTLNGEMLAPSGAVIAGKGRGLLALKRQIRELTTEIQRKKARLETLSRETETSRNALTEKLSLLDELSERTVEAEKSLSLLKHQTEQNAVEAERLNRKQAHLKIELDETEREKQSIAVLISAKREEIEKLESGKSGVENRIEELLKELNDLRSSFEQMRSRSVDLKLKINSSRERINSLINEKKSTERLSHELADKESLLAREIEATKERIEKFKLSEIEMEESLKTLAVEAQGMQSAVTSQRQDMTGSTESLRETEREMRNMRFKIDETTQLISELDVKRAENSVMLSNLTSNILNSYSVELKSVEPQEVTDEDMELMPELKAKLEKMGPVSLGSIEEYEELKTRYDFLTQQKDDLEKSIAELQEAISRINATTRKKLREAFDLLKNKFAEVFVALFGGGKAELVMTNPNNILETGLDIIAQPPGKRFQNISLLSGGEKTLTALALLFSGFLIKPTPLCVLDEADAALDESNTAKFAELLKELSSEIQFIVVTHNKVTMEAADFIYGVTMEEPGNSKTISMQLKDADQVMNPEVTNTKVMDTA